MSVTTSARAKESSRKENEASDRVAGGALMAPGETRSRGGVRGLFGFVAVATSRVHAAALRTSPAPSVTPCLFWRGRRGRRGSRSLWTRLPPSAPGSCARLAFARLCELPTRRLLCSGARERLWSVGLKSKRALSDGPADSQARTWCVRMRSALSNPSKRVYLRSRQSDRSQLGLSGRAIAKKLPGLSSVVCV